MKKKLFSIVIVLISFTVSAQVKFGIKAGTSFGYEGSLKQTVTNIKESKAKNNIGWHIGAFGRISIASWFLQPEMYYSSMKTEFNSSSEGTFSTHSNRLDIPVLAGKKILNIGRVYAGPVFSTSLKEDISLKNIKKTKTDDFSVAGQVGAGVDIAFLTLDVRYEFGFNKNQTSFVNTLSNGSFQMDKRQNSVVISAGYKF